MQASRASDWAVIDAACRGANVSFSEAMQGNLCGIAPAELAPDLGGFDADAFLAQLRPRDHIHARHTVGMVDPLTAPALRRPPCRAGRTCGR